MRKPIALLISFSIAAAILSGCGGSNNSKGSGNSGTSAPQQATAESSQTHEESQNTYTILVQDADNAAPLSGAMVQFCSDTQCLTARTDAAGTAYFEADPGSYTAHVLRVPEGYEAADQELVLNADSRTGVFVLRRSGRQ